MDLRLDEEHEALRAFVGEFARDEVAPVIGGYYQRGEFPYDLVARMGELGLFGLPLPEEYGGQGGDLLGLCVALEEIARVDSSLAITLEAAVSLGAMPILRYGTPEQRQRWLPALTSGQALAAFGLTEPGAGSDASRMRTTARLEDGSWIINGSKAFITNSGTTITSLIIVAAVTGSRVDGRPEISTFLVPTGTPGLIVEPAYAKVGWDASDTHPLSFVDVCVPADHLLGEQGRGYAQFLATLDEGRVAIAALATGLAQGCVDESVAYASDREAFGRPIGGHQAVAFAIADMEMRTHLARLAWRDAASALLRGERATRAASIAKLWSSEAAMANARAATQVFGGNGFMLDYPVGRFYRDAKILEIGEGTNEVQRMLISRELGLPRSDTA